jgi:uncharacterized SAM-binding protein YcdF (DUF218 family)
VFFLASKALSWVDLPATWVAALLAVAFLVRRRRALAAALVVIACATLGALASPPIVNALERVLVASGQSTMKPELEYDVAVVLAGSPARIVAGADVVRRGRARYLLYSGELDAAESAAVRSDLIARGVPGDRVVIEDRSRNTRENATESARVIAARGWRSILLVTSAAHVERAAGCFHRIGLRPDVLPVTDTAPLLHVWPRAVALERSSALLHELVGRLVYRVLGYSER